jgi:hypothetical protein
MAGYGNRTAPDYVAEDLEDQHTATRLGLHESNTPYHNPHEKHGSGMTGGAGFGTSSVLLAIPHTHTDINSVPTTTPSDTVVSENPLTFYHLGNKRSSSTPTDTSLDASEFRFGLHTDTAPYSNATPMGSGSTGGAGYGNKTGEMEGPSKDSALGKIVEKVGGIMGSEKAVVKGRGMREKKGFGGEE